jgi:hypothetical protein
MVDSRGSPSREISWPSAGEVSASVTSARRAACGGSQVHAQTASIHLISVPRRTP